MTSNNVTTNQALVSAFEARLLDIEFDFIDRVRSAKRLIYKALKSCDYSNYFAGTSGGKDSLTVASLVSSVQDNDSVLDLIHNPKPYPKTHPATKDYLYYLAMQSPIAFVPSVDMGRYCKAKGFKLQFDGTRKAEFSREDKSTDFIMNGEAVCRTKIVPFIERGIFDLSVAFPILDWSDEDVLMYLYLEGIPLSDEYSDVYPYIWEDTNV